jgi:hypothetical protein
MGKTKVFRSNRREFLSRIPAAAALCLGCSQGWMFSSSQNTHKFQREMPPMTYLRWAQQRNSRYIGILKHLEKDIGKQRFLELLKKASYAENVALGKRLSPRIDSMKTFAGPFRDENSGVGRTIVREIIEDNETAFEMKITECLTEIVFRKADAVDLGYACVCHADFGLPEGLDIGIKLIRTKTLMQGHDCCNHRYVLGGDNKHCV